MPDRIPHEHGIDRIAERHLRNWELARQQRLTREGQKQQKVEDFVCISRDAGAEAMPIGTMLGERLGWPVFDKELLHVMAEDSSLRERIYSSMDEQDLNWREETLRSLFQPEFTKNDYFHKLTKTILSLARKGNAVFIGRGAELLLPREMGLRVRVVTPLAMRIKQLAEQKELSEAAARNEIEKIEAERARFIRKHFGIDVHDLERFDLVINRLRISDSQAVDLILSARALLAGKYPPLHR